MGKINAKPVQKSSPQMKSNRPIKQEIESPSATPPPSQSPRRSQLQRSRRPEDDVPSTSHPPVPKRARSERRAMSVREIKQEEGTTTTTSSRRRRNLKHGEVAAPKCCFCQKEQTDELEPLKECMHCKGYFHVEQCLRYKENLAGKVVAQDLWLCPRCVNCQGCGSFIDDPFNVECQGCSEPFHGECATDGGTPFRYNAPYFCPTCHKEDCESGVSSTTRHRHAPIHRSPVVADRKSSKLTTKLEFDTETTDELTKLLNQRDFIFEKYNYKAGFSTKEPTPLVYPNRGSENSKADAKRRSTTLSDGSDILQIDKEKRIEQFLLPVDREIYELAHEEAYADEPPARAEDGGQWLHFATGTACKSIYKSAYDEPRASATDLFACKFCLYTTHLKNDFKTHFLRCEVNYPPGNEIYRHESMSFFEVDGAKEKKYCQNLCLLAKLFIASKTLYDEVETFIFYVLCELTDEGFVMVGYFSKEKNPSKNNNLSCLLVLPAAQKKGYGQLLIDMSYELSRIEHRVGHPEHPLSDLGILAYRTYWRSSILCYLRSRKITEKISLKEMCLHTRITQVDLVNQMMLDNMIILKDGHYFIKLGKRALKYPLCQSRRRAVHRSKIRWEPKPTDEVLDPRKINTYV